MACDLIVAAEDAQLGEPEIRFGSAPVTLLMPYLIGQKKTRELLLTGDLIDGVEAERIGLVNRVVPADRLAAEVDALADRLARIAARGHGADQADAQPGDGGGRVPARRSRPASTSSRSINMSDDARARVRRDRPARRPQGRPGLARPALRRAPRGERPRPGVRPGRRHRRHRRLTGAVTGPTDRPGWSSGRSRAAGSVSLSSGSQQAIFTHRVVRIAIQDGQVWVETKGDANATADPSLTPATAVIGRVSVSLPGMGYAITLLSSISGVIFVSSLGLILFIAGGLLDGRRPGHRAVPPEREAGAVGAIDPA